MALMDMFRSAAAPAPVASPNIGNTGNRQQSAPTDGGAQQGVQGPGAQPNGGQQAPTPNAGNQAPVNPLDSFTKMWDNPNQGQTDKAPAFTLDDKVLDSVSSQQDFLKGANPELVQKATSGDVSALMELIQHVGRNAYKSSIRDSGMLTDKFVGAREGFNEKSFSSKVRGELTTQALANTPNFSHPVVRKQLTDVATRLQAQHPDAQPQEIADMAKEYITELASALNPKDTAAEAKAAAKGTTDWDTFFQE